MALINLSKYGLTKRTVKSCLKKLDRELEYREDNIYEHTVCDAICAYISKNGTANTKLSAMLCIQEMEIAIENERINKELAEKRKTNSDHKITNIKYNVENQDNIILVNEAIYNNLWTKEYEEIEGYSLVAKDIVGKYVIEEYEKCDKKRQFDIIQRILLMYNSIVKHMKDEVLLFEDIASRYHFKESVEFLKVIKKIIDTESLS